MYVSESVKFAFEQAPNLNCQISCICVTLEWIITKNTWQMYGNCNGIIIYKWEGNVEDALK
jgi:hypothetical protein